GVGHDSRCCTCNTCVTAAAAQSRRQRSTHTAGHETPHTPPPHAGPQGRASGDRPQTRYARPTPAGTPSTSATPDRPDQRTTAADTPPPQPQRTGPPPPDHAIVHGPGPPAPGVLHQSHAPRDDDAPSSTRFPVLIPPRRSGTPGIRRNRRDHRRTGALIIGKIQRTDETVSNKLLLPGLSNRRMNHRLTLA